MALYKHAARYFTELVLQQMDLVSMSEFTPAQERCALLAEVAQRAAEQIERLRTPPPVAAPTPPVPATVAEGHDL